MTALQQNRMTRILLPILAFVFAISTVGCSEDFEVAAPYKDVTVVYGVLDIADATHYIRVQKAFLDENKNAFDMAKEADSLYYTNIRVEMKEINRANLNVENVTTLTRVDLDAIGKPKAAGDFATSPNYAYEYTRNLNAGRQYRLVITNLSTGAIDSATTLIVGPNFVITELISDNRELSFDKTESPTTDVLTFTTQVPDNGVIFEAMMRFHYVDSNLANATSVEKFIDIPFAGGTVATGNNVKLSIANASLYTAIANAMGVPDNGSVVRYMDSVDVFVAAGNQNLYDYERNANLSGITADQIKPVYSNVRGTNGISLGVLGSKGNFVRRNRTISIPTILELGRNPITVNLRINGRRY